MATIGFIGLGNMGAPMAAQPRQGRPRRHGFDRRRSGARRSRRRRRDRGGERARRRRPARDVVITMLPAGRHVLDGLCGATASSPPPGPARS